MSQYVINSFVIIPPGHLDIMNIKILNSFVDDYIWQIKDVIEDLLEKLEKIINDNNDMYNNKIHRYIINVLTNMVNMINIISKKYDHLMDYTLRLVYIVKIFRIIKLAIISDNNNHNRGIDDVTNEEKLIIDQYAKTIMINKQLTNIILEYTNESSTKCNPMLYLKESISNLVHQSYK